MTTGPDGILVVDKPEGPTSHDVVAVARRALRTPRVGHTGTLDPMASGVLVLVLGRATRLARYLTHDAKEYDAQVAFGRATTTYDAQGATTMETGRAPSRGEVEAELARYACRQFQTPPPYSAKKVAGKVAHRAARQEAPLDLPPTPVTVHALALRDFADGMATLSLRVSAGFYVRSLAHDLGVALGTGAHLAGLRRTAAGEFTLPHAVPLGDLAGRAAGLEPALIPIDRMLHDMPAVPVSEADADRIRHGQGLARQGLSVGAGPLRLLSPEGRLVAVAEVRAGAGPYPGPFLQPVVVVG
ncbi:MAG: tRNA pseudouridine(55) synthase TruB [Vicinamibacterales bacterium]